MAGRNVDLAISLLEQMDREGTVPASAVPDISAEMVLHYVRLSRSARAVVVRHLIAMTQEPDLRKSALGFTRLSQLHDFHDEVRAMIPIDTQGKLVIVYQVLLQRRALSRNVELEALIGMKPE